MISTADQGRLTDWICARLGLEMEVGFTCIGNVSGSRIRGVVGFTDYNGASMQMHVAGEGNWATKSLMHAAFDYPFNQCGVNILLAYVAATNIKSVAMCHHVGFRIEHILKDAHPDGDLIIFSMRRRECRSIQRGHRHEIREIAAYA